MPIWKNILIHTLFSVDTGFTLERRDAWSMSPWIGVTEQFPSSWWLLWLFCTQPQQDLQEVLWITAMERTWWTFAIAKPLKSSHFNSLPLWFLFLLALCWPTLDYTNSSALPASSNSPADSFRLDPSFFPLSPSALTITGFFELLVWLLHHSCWKLQVFCPTVFGEEAQKHHTVFRT